MKLRLWKRFRHLFTFNPFPHTWVKLGTKGELAHWECTECGKHMVTWSDTKADYAAIERVIQLQRDRKWP